MQAKTSEVLMPGQHEPLPRPWQMRAGATLGPCFNAAASVPRLVFLVSPTCEVCVSGARSAAQAVLLLPPESHFRLYLLWLPVLENDTIEAAVGMRVHFPADDRVWHFWDDDLVISKTFHQVLQLGQRQRRHRVAWDLFLLYRAGVTWGDVPSVPDFWMHQLFLDDVPKLEVDILKRQLEQTINVKPIP